jgi:hypothetical protein
LFLAAGCTGMRLAELLELTWGSIDSASARIVARSRLVPLHDRDAR